MTKSDINVNLMYNMKAELPKPMELTLNSGHANSMDMEYWRYPNVTSIN